MLFPDDRENTMTRMRLLAIAAASLAIWTVGALAAYVVFRVIH